MVDRTPGPNAAGYARWWAGLGGTGAAVVAAWSFEWDTWARAMWRGDIDGWARPLVVVVAAAVGASGGTVLGRLTARGWAPGFGRSRHAAVRRSGLLAVGLGGLAGLGVPFLAAQPADRHDAGWAVVGVLLAAWLLGGVAVAVPAAVERGRAISTWRRARAERRRDDDAVDGRIRAAIRGRHDAPIRAVEGPSSES